MAETGGRLVVKRFPADLHRRLRVAAAESDPHRDMREIVIAALEYHLVGVDPAPEAPERP